MVLHQGSTLARWLRTHYKLVTFSFFLGFGLSGCSDSDSPDEPVAADEAQQATGDEAAPADATPPPEAEAAPAPEEAAPPADDSASNDDAPKATPDESPNVDAQSDTAKAELTADQPAAEAPGALPTDGGDGNNLDKKLEPEPALNTPPPPAPMPMADAGMPSGDTLSSPGAAKYIKGKHEKHHHDNYMSEGTGAASGGDASYVVQLGDTLSTIASKIYGKHGNWHTLAEMNGFNAPYLLHPGDEVRYDSSVPGAKSFAQHYKGSMKTWVVKHGDTLSGIAQEVYGTSFAWKQLAAYNKGKLSNPNYIGVGMRLRYVDTGNVSTAMSAKEPEDAPAVQTLPVKASKSVAKQNKAPEAKAPAVEAQPEAAQPEEMADEEKAPAPAPVAMKKPPVSAPAAQPVAAKKAPAAVAPDADKDEVTDEAPVTDAPTTEPVDAPVSAEDLGE